MTSILFADTEVDDAAADEPEFFRDLNLDQVVDAIVAGRDEYDLKQFFYLTAQDVDLVAYRQDVFRDLEVEDVRAAVRGYADSMQRVRRYLGLAEKLRYEVEQQRWRVDAAALYCDAVAALDEGLGRARLRSRGLRAIAEHVSAYAASEGFTSLRSDAAAALDALSRVHYALRINGARVTVGRYEGEDDLSIEVERTFARFRQGAVDDHLVNVPDSGSMDRVEARIAELVARLHPAEFGPLVAFCERHTGFVEPLLARFDREVQFYLAVIELSERVANGSRAFAYPEVGADEILVEDGFDLALAIKLGPDAGSIVRNDFALRAPERILVVTGPNQGGKTTFARMVGQLHYLAALGMPVPARTARLQLPDRLFTHFEREEDIATLRGKLDDELVRIRDILEIATARSVVILNEVFASTTLADAILLGTEVLERIAALGCVAVLVTFVDELASMGPTAASMVAGDSPDDPSQRTYRVERRPADGRAYAWAIADKYGVSYERLRKRIGG